MADRMPVGQVWIRVSPDTRGFADETRDQLRKMKSLDKYKVPIEVELDTEKVEADFAKLVKKLQKKAGTDEYRVKIQTELEFRRGDGRKQIRDAVKQYQDMADDQQVKIKTNLDNDSVADRGYSPTVNMDVDEDRFERDVKKLMEKTKADMTVTVDKKTLRDEVNDTVKEVSDLFKNIRDREKNKLQIKVDTDELHKAEKFLSEMQEQYNGAAGAIESTQRELARVTREYRQIARELTRLENAKRRLDISNKDDARTYGQMAGQIGKLNEKLKLYDGERRRLMKFGRENYLEVEVNMESMRKAEEQIDELRDRVEEVASEIEVGISHASVAAVSAELLAITRPRVINIYTNLRNNAKWEAFWSKASGSADDIANSMMRYSAQITGLRLLKNTLTDMIKIVPKLDMIIPSLAAGSVAAVSAISAASYLLGSVLSIGADLMHVFNLALALPSVLVGLTGSVLIIGRAIKDFKTTFPEIISYWKELGNVVSDRVWSRAAGKVRDLHKALVPILDAGVPAWATAWGDTLGSFADGLGEAVAGGHLKEFLDNSIKGTKAAEAGWKSLGSALLRMVGIGSRTFPQMGEWFSRNMESFDSWVQKNDKNGNFEKWIDDGTRALKNFGSVVWSTGSILRSLGNAARRAGLPSLTDFAEGMASMAERMKAPRGMDSFIGPLENMVGFMEEIMTLGPLFGESVRVLWELLGNAALELAGPIKGALEGILTAFTSAGFQEDMNSFFDSMGSFIEDVTPGLESLTREFGSMAAIVGTAAKSWAPAFNEMLLLFEDLGKGMNPGLKSFLESTGPALEKLVKDLRPEVEKLGNAIGDLLADPSFQSFVRYMIDSLGEILILAVRVGTGLLIAFKGFARWWDSQPEWFKDLSTDLLVVSLLLPAIGTGFMVIKKVLGPAVAVLMGLGRAFRFLGAAMRGIGGALLASGLARGGIGGLVARLLGRSLLVGSGPLGWGLLIASLVPVGLPGIIVDAILHALGLDGSLIDRLAEGISGAIEDAFGGGSLLSLIAAPLADAWNEFVSGDIVGGIVALFTPFGKGGIVTIIVKAILSALGIEVGTGTYGTAFTEEGAWGVIKLIFADIWEAFTTAISDGWDWLVQKILDWTPDWGVDIANWIVDHLPDWLTGGANTGHGDGQNWGNSLSGAFGGSDWGTAAWNEGIKPWLEGGWKSLIRLILGWVPATLFNILGWIGSKLSDWLNGPVGAGKSFVKGVGGILDWGADKWTKDVKPWLDRGWATLKGRIGEWSPEGESGLGTAIDRALGTDPISTARTAEGFTEIGRNLGKFATDGLANLGTLSNGGRREIEGLADTTDAEFGRMSLSGSTNTSSMSTGVVANIGTMTASTLAKLASMKTDGSRRFDELNTSALGSIGSMRDGVATRSGGMSQKFQDNVNTMATRAIVQLEGLKNRSNREFDGMNAGALTKSRSMRDGVSSATSGMSRKVADNMGTMATRAIAHVNGMKNKSNREFDNMNSGALSKTGSLKRGVGSNLEATKNAAGSSASQTRAQYIAQMVRMQIDAIRYAGMIRSRLPGVLSINTGGAGRHTGSSYVSGLAGGLSRAVGVARGMAGGIRSALSFSAFGSGASVGGSFASGIRSRVGAARAAASALAGAVRRMLPNSPAAEGPFSGSGWGGWGESIGNQLIFGLKYAAPEVAMEAESLMAGVHSALDTKAEVGFGVSTDALNAAFAGAEVQAAEFTASQITAADVENGVANGLARLIKPASERDLVALVRTANKNGAR